MGNPKFNFIYIKELLKDLKDELVNEGTFCFLSRQEDLANPSLWTPFSKHF